MFKNIKGAFNSIWNNKITSLLTILGVVIGVTAVIVLISLGQGLKNDVSGLIQGLGSNIIGITGGKIDTENMSSGSSQINPAQFIATDILTEKDVVAIRNTEGVKDVFPMSMISSAVRYQDKMVSPAIVGTDSKFIEGIELMKLDRGRIFKDNVGEHSIIIPVNMVDALFTGVDPLNKKVTLGQYEFEVIGVFQKPSGSVVGGEYDNMAMIPFDAATLINKDQVKIYRMMVKADENADVKTVKAAVKESMLKSHNGEENFSVLTQDDLLSLFDQFLSLATTMVSAIAAISLIVGGIGIMNIMLVTVSERTSEIGLRKAVGASRMAILSQFLVEAVIITLLGGLIGLGVSYFATYIIAQKSSLNPEITPDIIALALGISSIIGIIFGLWPALRAANKDPIEALRHE